MTRAVPCRVRSLIGARAVSTLGTLLFSISAAGAQAPADFYQGRTITLVVSTSPGGDYDTRARLLARHMPRFIPGTPKIVVQNMPGGGGLRGANWLYNVGAQDGTALAALRAANSTLTIVP